MKDKVLVEVYLPMAEQTFETLLPKDIRIADAISLLSRVFSDLANVFYESMDNDVLCDRETGAIYNIGITVREANILNGSRLMLM